MQENNLERKLRAILSAEVRCIPCSLVDFEFTIIRTIAFYREPEKSLIRDSRPLAGGILKKGGA